MGVPQHDRPDTRSASQEPTDSMSDIPALQGSQPPVPLHNELLLELDELGYAARIKRAATLGRNARSNIKLNELMKQLLSGDAFESNLALEMAQGARNSNIVEAGLTNSSSLVRRRASQFAGHIIKDDHTIERLLPDLSAFARKAVLKSIVTAGRTALAKRVLPLVQSSVEKAVLLPALDPATVRGILTDLEYNVLNRAKLVRRFPDEVLDCIGSIFKGMPTRLRSSLFLQFHPALVRLTTIRLHPILDLVLKYSSPDTLPCFVMDRLPFIMRKDSNFIFEYITRPAFRRVLLHRYKFHKVLLHARRFTQEQQMAIARILADEPMLLGDFLASLPWSKRTAVFTHAFETTVPRQLLPDNLLAVLPDKVRDAVAACQLELREVQESEELQLTMQAFRIISNAREPLQQAAQASKAEKRAKALALLVYCTGLSRSGLDRTLEYLSRLKNEQDPVRSEVLAELSCVPATVFSAEHVALLEEQVTYTVQAPDVSHSTRTALQTLALKLIRVHDIKGCRTLLAFALDTLRKLADQSGTLSLPSLERTLPPGMESRVVNVMLPLMRRKAELGEFKLIFHISEALGQRAWHLDDLQTLLESITRAKPVTDALKAIEFWLAPKKLRDNRVRKLLDWDQSVYAISPVFHHMDCYRQEWLDPYLGGLKINGHFTPDILLQTSRKYYRWLPRQQETSKEQLLLIAQDVFRDSSVRIWAIQTLSRMPVATVDTFADFMKSDNVAIVEASLRALSCLDQCESSLSILLDNLGGDRARVAVYALRSIAKQAQPSVISTILETLLKRPKLKITVHKEILRLIGTLGLARGMAILRQEWDKPNLHCDVRIAVGHAARQLMHDPASWTLLEAIAQSPDADVAESLLNVSPKSLNPTNTLRYAALVLEVSRHPDMYVRRHAFVELTEWIVGIEERVAHHAAEIVVDLAATEWYEAMEVLVDATSDGKAFDQVVASVQTLVSMPRTPSNDLKRDIPARQRLVKLCEKLVELSRPLRLGLCNQLHEVAEVVRKDRTAWFWSAALRLGGIQWSDREAAGKALQEVTGEVKNDPLAVPALTRVITEALQDGAPEDMVWCAQFLHADHPLTAVSLLSKAWPTHQSHSDAVQLLQTLRQHPHHLVCAAAYDIVIVEE